MLHLKENTLLQQGKYRIIRLLGQGGFGITYLAEDTDTGKKVAIKEFFFKSSSHRDSVSGFVTVLEQTRSDAEKLRVKFIKEGNLLASFNNKHIVKVYDMFDQNNTSYYVMDYVEGRTLQSLIEAGPIPENIALDYIKQASEALSYIHNRKVMHLDIKPENIMLRNDGRIILIDFGISKHYDESGKQTSMMQGAFTRYYAAPEQINCDVMEFTPATDVYSLGATLYSLLTAKKPKDSYAIKLHGLGQKPSSISRNVWNAMQKAMKYDIVDRPKSANEFIALLAKNSSGDDDTIIIDAPNSEETVLINQARPKRSGDRKPPITSKTQNTYTPQVNKPNDEEEFSIVGMFYIIIFIVIVVFIIKFLIS